MNLKRTLTLLCLIISLWSTAQIKQDSLLFRGVIMEGDSLFSLPYAKYMINNQARYTANEAGQFSFWAKTGDIIHFSYVGFKPYYLQVNDSLANKNYLMGVFLSRDTIELSEVLIIPQVTNPHALARNMPMLSTVDDMAAQNNVAMSTYQAKTQAVTQWDAEMNQKNFIQARSNDIAYQTQIQPQHILGVSNVAISKEVTRSKLKNMQKPRRPYITQAEWEYLISTYNERLKKTF